MTTSELHERLDDVAPLGSAAQPSSPEFQANAEWMRGLVTELREREAVVRAGGGERSVERHHARGKLLARERIERLLDPASPFLELSHWRPRACTATKRPAQASSPASGASPGARC